MSDAATGVVTVLSLLAFMPGCNGGFATIDAPCRRGSSRDSEVAAAVAGIDLAKNDDVLDDSMAGVGGVAGVALFLFTMTPEKENGTAARTRKSKCIFDTVLMTAGEGVIGNAPSKCLYASKGKILLEK
jgi:hypothetical protein